MVRSVNLDEKKHAVKMLRGLRQMKKQENQCDFVIKLGEKEYRAHKTVLSVGSPYFKAMFKRHTNETEEGEVEMKDVDHECLKSCIDFIYTGNFDIPDGKIGDLLHVAVMLQLDDVKKAIREILHEELNVENFYETRNISELYGFRTLASKCKMFFEEQFSAIYTQPQFKYEDKSYWVGLLKSKKQLLSEDTKLNACLTWFDSNPNEKESFAEMMKHIELKKVSAKVLRGLLENNPMVKSNLSFCEAINDTLDVISKRSRRRIVILDDSDPNPPPLLSFRESRYSLHSYDPFTNEITKFHDNLGLPDIFSVISMDNYVYVLTDRNIRRFNFEDQASRWEYMECMHVDHGWRPPVVSLLGSLFVIGRDYDMQTPIKDVERFDPGVKKWFKLKKRPQAFSHTNLVSLDDSIYCIGGCPIPLEMDPDDEKSRTNVVSRFTPKTSKWVDLEPMRVARLYCGPVAVEQKIYVIGWDDEEGCECYDIKAGQWTSISPMIDWHDLSDAHYIDGFIYVVEHTETVRTMEKYDIKADKWFKVGLDEKTYPFTSDSSVTVQLRK